MLQRTGDASQQLDQARDVKDSKITSRSSAPPAPLFFIATEAGELKQGMEMKTTRQLHEETKAKEAKRSAADSGMKRSASAVSSTARASTGTESSSAATWH